MRTAFFATLLEIAERDPRVNLVIGDLGFGVVEQFATRFPERFLNAGIAEQTMTGVAAGLAMEGNVVVTYSIGNFPTLRCIEQIRNDVCYQDANVKIVAVGGGLAYGALGVSHHATEDLAMMRAIPNLLVAAPGDPLETAAVAADALSHEGPVYIRLGKAGEPTVHERAVDRGIGRAIDVRPGSDLTFISTGGMLADTVAAAERLEREGLSAGVVSMPWIVPLDDEAILARAVTSQLLVTVEEHSIVGGLGGAVAEVLAEHGAHAPLLRVGLPRRFESIVGDQTYLKALHGIDAEGIATRARVAFKELT